MEENNNENLYKIYSSDMKEKKPSFLKNAIVPFCSSVLGTALVIGVCFGIPGIKNTILNTETVTTDTGLTITEGKVNNTVSLPDYSNTSIAVANKVLPSIVGITVEYKVNSMFGGSSISEASGSGIIVSSDGYILTNNHVVNSTSSASYFQITEATGVKVKLYGDENEYTATVVGSDEQTDLAVM